ncbi:MAG: hypothetical protein ACRBFS_15055 [Aureispira sp.]
MPIPYLFFWMCCFCCLACSTNRQFSNNTSNYEATQKKYPTLIKHTTANNDWCKAQYAPAFRVLQLQGKQLYDCLKFQPKALVYTWVVQAEEQNYPSIDSIQKHCDSQGIRLYVVADCYQGTLLKKEYALDYPIIGINTIYYQSDAPSIYHKKFLQDLGIILKEETEGRLHYFQSGNYRGAYKVLESI